MTDLLATCRQALNDASHPLHQAVWLLFGSRINLKAADRLLANQKAAVIQLCFDILETDALYDEASLGSGHAPIRCVELLAHWKVQEAVPRLWRIIQEEDAETLVYNAAMLALEHWGPDLLEDTLRRAETADPDLHIAIGAILSENGRGDPRAYAWVKARFDEQRHEQEIRFWAEMLLVAGGEEAIAHLEERILTRRKYSPNLKRILRRYIDDYRRTGTL
jgi:hypothetical protein